MNPPPGPRGTWSTAVELLRQVCRLVATRNVSHRPLYLGRNSGPSDRPIPVCDGRSNPFVFGAGELTYYCVLNYFN